MKNRTIHQKYELLKEHKHNYSYFVNENINRINNSISNNENIVLFFNRDEALKKAELLDKNFDNSITSIYTGITCLVKDNININNFINTSGSKVLQNYVSPYNATIINNLNKFNCINLGTANLDEFGHAGTGMSSAFGIVKNHINNNCITGGSSSGGVAAVREGLCDFSVGTDTGDSIRHPASFMGVVGYKPSYGLVSRYGVMPYASSLDHVGVITNDVTDAAIAIDLIKGYDSKDLTSYKEDIGSFYTNLTKLEQPKILILDDLNKGLDSDLLIKWDKLINDIKLKTIINNIDFGQDLLNVLLPLYVSISYMEGFSNWSNVNGILFGSNEIPYKNYEDLMLKTRSQFGMEVKKRYQAFNLFYNENNFDEIYEKSNKIRKIIVNKINKLLDEYDAILIPAASSTAPKIKDILNNVPCGNYCDDGLLLANFAGLPSITIPITSFDSNKPFGVNLISKKYDDQKLLNIALWLEENIKEKGYYD